MKTLLGSLLPAFIAPSTESSSEVGQNTPAGRVAGGAPAVSETDKAQRPGLFETVGAMATGAVKQAYARALDAGQQGLTEAAEGLLSLSNFLRVAGSGEQAPKLYAPLIKLDVPSDRVVDAGALELKGPALEQLGTLLRAIGRGHLDGTLDLSAGDQAAFKSLFMAANLGLMTDALKVKMTGWNMLTPQLRGATTSFELGIRKMPSGSNTNFWVIGGVNKSIEWVKNLRVSPEAVEWMKNQPLFKGYPKEFFEYFSPPVDGKGVRIPGKLSPFEQDVQRCKIEALADGEVYMGGPIMRVSGPPAAVEFLETNLMRLVTSWTTVATAAAQMTLAADGKPVAYFGPRRAPGGEDVTEAVSNAAAIGGMTVSSDLLGGLAGNTITGTMEHSIMLMLKMVFKTDRPTFSAATRDKATDLLKTSWKSADPSLTPAQLDEKVSAQLEDVLVEAHIFKTYANEFDGEKSVALVDTTHPNVGVAAAMLAQHMLWEEQGKGANMNAIRLDSGCLLAQGLQYRRLLNECGMPHLKILATDGLLPETVKFFEQVEREVRKAEGKGALQPSFYKLLGRAPASVGEGEELEQIEKMAEALVDSGGLHTGQPLFAGYGAGEKIADSVSTVGRPGIVYKASQMTFKSETTGENVTVNMGKIPSPDKATGPNRQLFAKVGADGKIEQWVIASPNEKPGSGFQALMRTVFENGTLKTNTSQAKAVAYAADRRAALGPDVRDGGKPKLGMTQQYKDEWLEVVRQSDPTRVAEFSAYFDRTWPTVAMS